MACAIGDPVQSGRGVLQILQGKAHPPRPRALSWQRAVRPCGARRVPGRLPAAQGALRSLGDGAADPAPAPRRPHRRSAAGHGLLAHLLLLLDDSSPEALLIDTAPPPSAVRLHAVLMAWPRLAGRVVFERRSLASVTLCAGDLVASSHACGALADVVLDAAAAARARVAVLPCCHDHAANDSGSLSGWLDRSLAVDVMRAVRLEQRGYRVWTQTIPAAITPKNRLLLGEPL